MASLVLSGDTSGSITVSAPAVAGSTTQTLVNVTDTLAPVVRGTAVASTSGTSIDFTGIPSWVKRITVMFNGVSLNSTGQILIQIGTGGTPTTTGYTSSSGYIISTGATSGLTSTSGFIIQAGANGYIIFGSATITNISGNIWVCQGITANNVSASYVNMNAGGVSLGGILNMVRITSSSGTDTFDAGTINILYE